MGALLFREISDIEADNIKVRQLLLRKLQSDFKENQNNITDSKKFCDQVTVLCELFRNLRIKGSPIDILSSAVIIYFERLLQGNRDELQVLLEQLPKIKKELESCNRKKFEEFLLAIRRKLISDSLLLNESSRALLLALFERSLKGREPLEPIVVDLYEKYSGICFDK